MKIIYFLRNGVASTEDKIKRDELKKTGDAVYFSNGSLAYGFEDSCNAVYLSDDFPLVESWANSKGIEVIKPKQPEPTPEPEPEPKKTTVKKTTKK